MRGLAKFLGFLYAVLYWLLVIVTVLVAIGGVLLVAGFDVSRITDAVGQSVTIPELGTYTAAQLAQLRMPILVALICLIIIMVLSLRSIRMVRRALKQTGMGYPFSMITVKSLRMAGILILINGIIGIITPFILSFLFTSALDMSLSNLSLSSTVNLAFIFNALVMFLLSAVAKYGNSLAPSEDVFPEAETTYSDTEEY
jgi:hypothetical protein